MMPKTEKVLHTRDAKRDVGKELLKSVREMKARKKGRVTKVTVSWVIKVRMKTGLPQSAFAELLGVSVRTLQDWEQGRREPSGAAKSLLKIAEKHPEALIELAA
jgi:putative transcriptional regulator